MENKLKKGDYVETCSLLPGIVMSFDQGNVEIRILSDIAYEKEEFSWCSIEHCAVRKLRFDLVKMMIVLGKERLTEIYDIMRGLNIEAREEFYIEYDRRIEEAYHELIRD